MIKHSLLILFCTIQLAINAQFNNLYLTDQRGFGMAVEEDEVTGNYIFPYLFGDPGLGETSLGILKIAPDGSIIEVISTLENQPALLIAEAGGFFETSDDGHIFATGNDGAYIVKFDYNMQIIWEATNQIGVTTGYWGGRELYNNDLIFGYINPQDPYNVLSMDRYSSDGELISEFEIQLDSNFFMPTSFNVKDSIVFVSFHHYIVGEYRRNSIVAYNAFTGEEIWEVSQIENDIALAYTDPVMCWNNEGELIYLYHQIEWTILPTSLDMGYTGRTKLAKIDLESGQFLVDQYISDVESNTSLHGVVTTEDDGLIILSRGYAANSPNQVRPRIEKLNSNFEREWMYAYKPPDPFNTPSGNKLLFDIEVTNDDCIIAAGVCSGPHPITNEIYENPWLVKIDACGNEIITDCSLSGLGELSGRNKISIYPNPARDRIFLKAENAIQHAMIFDMNGKMVHNEVFSGAQEQTLFIDHLPEGLYLVNAIDSKGIRSSGKIMLER